MPYEYRRLTAEERDEVLRQRRERGYPLHSPPHPYRGAAHYLITAANYEHSPIMAASARRTEFEGALLAAMQGILADVFGWVILPNHYHVVVAVADLASVTNAIKKLHGATARAWNQEDEQTGSRKVWYKYSDQVIRDDDHFGRVLNYVHVNPMKHGYVDDPYSWPWSSVHNYYETRGREWLREQWLTHPPGDLGKGWDW